jgi:hypothetical protein
VTRNRVGPCYVVRDMEDARWAARHKVHGTMGRLARCACSSSRHKQQTQAAMLQGAARPAQGCRRRTRLPAALPLGLIKDLLSQRVLPPPQQVQQPAQAGAAVGPARLQRLQSLRRQRAVWPGLHQSACGLPHHHNVVALTSEVQLLVALVDACSGTEQGAVTVAVARGCHSYSI